MNDNFKLGKSRPVFSVDILVVFKANSLFKNQIKFSNTIDENGEYRNAHGIDIFGKDDTEKGEKEEE